MSIEMSADNGIFILQTEGPEFRVEYLHNIDEMYGNFSDDTYQWQGDPEIMYEYFGKSMVFDNLEMALDFAAELSYGYEYLEYGICVIRDFQDWDFNKLKERYGKEAESGTR